MKKPSFTLLELTVVLIIVGVLATLGLPPYMASIEKAKNREAIVNLKAIVQQYKMKILKQGNAAVASCNMAATCANNAECNSELGLSLPTDSNCNWVYVVNGNFASILIGAQRNVPTTDPRYRAQVMGTGIGFSMDDPICAPVSAYCGN